MVEDFVNKENKKNEKNNEEKNNKNNNGFIKNENTLSYQVLNIKRISRTVQGGRKMRFNALVVVGDKNGKCGFALEKNNETLGAIKKAFSSASKRMINVFINKKNFSIESQVYGKFGATKVFLRPAPQGTGIVAGGPVRAILELAGVKNVTSKVYGSKTRKNVLEATFKAIKELNKRHFIRMEIKNEIASINKK